VAEERPAESAVGQSAAQIEAPPELKQPERKQKDLPSPSLPSKAPKPAVMPTVLGGTTEFRLPELGENIEQGDLVKLMVAPGTFVAEGQPVMELETDKAVVEVPSSVTGTVKEIRVKQGDKVKVGQVIFTAEAAVVSAAAVGDEQHDGQLSRDAYQAAIRAEGKTERAALPPDKPRPSATVFEMPSQLAKTAGPDQGTPVPAAPHVRRLARELGIDINRVQGTGPGGRISEDDVKAYAKQVIIALPTVAPPPEPVAPHPSFPILPDFSKWGKIERVAMRSVRRKTAEHLWEAWHTVPHVTQHDYADITELEQLRLRFAPRAERVGGKMTMTVIALKVCASALKVFPQFNASLDLAKEEVIYKQYVNIGVAVDTERGLLVPVIRDVDRKNITELAAELTQFSSKAREKKLAPSDMEGGTFTITNLGGIGGTAFTPIVNFPEVAILGLSRSRMEPVWREGKFEPRLMLPLSLSYDHRLIDGADAARFLRWVAEALEQPFLLSVQG